MTATMMVDGRKRTQPVTLIHATAAPTGWLLAKVSTVVISPPKWHLKCEAMAVVVAQSPRAGPRTRALNPPCQVLHWGHGPLSKFSSLRCSHSTRWHDWTSAKWPWSSLLSVIWCLPDSPFNPFLFCLFLTLLQCIFFMLLTSFCSDLLILGTSVLAWNTCIDLLLRCNKQSLRKRVDWQVLFQGGLER